MTRKSSRLGVDGRQGRVLGLLLLLLYGGRECFASVFIILYGLSLVKVQL